MSKHGLDTRVLLGERYPTQFVDPHELAFLAWSGLSYPDQVRARKKQELGRHVILTVDPEDFNGRHHDAYCRDAARTLARRVATHKNPPEFFWPSAPDHLEIANGTDDPDPPPQEDTAKIDRYAFAGVFVAGALEKSINWGQSADEDDVTLRRLFGDDPDPRLSVRLHFAQSRRYRTSPPEDWDKLPEEWNPTDPEMLFYHDLIYSCALGGRKWEEWNPRLTNVMQAYHDDYLLARDKSSTLPRLLLDFEEIISGGEGPYDVVSTIRLVRLLCERDPERAQWTLAQRVRAAHDIADDLSLYRSTFTIPRLRGCPVASPGENAPVPQLDLSRVTLSELKGQQGGSYYQLDLDGQVTHEPQVGDADTIGPNLWCPSRLLSPDDFDIAFRDPDRTYNTGFEHYLAAYVHAAINTAAIHEPSLFGCTESVSLHTSEPTPSIGRERPPRSRSSASELGRFTLHVVRLAEFRDERTAYLRWAAGQTALRLAELQTVPLRWPNANDHLLVNIGKFAPPEPLPEFVTVGATRQAHKEVIHTSAAEWAIDWQPQEQFLEGLDPNQDPRYMIRLRLEQSGRPRKRIEEYAAPYDPEQCFLEDVVAASLAGGMMWRSWNAELADSLTKRYEELNHNYNLTQLPDSDGVTVGMTPYKAIACIRTIRMLCRQGLAANFDLNQRVCAAHDIADIPGIFLPGDEYEGLYRIDTKGLSMTKRLTENGLYRYHFLRNDQPLSVLQPNDPTLRRPTLPYAPLSPDNHRIAYRRRGPKRGFNSYSQAMLHAALNTAAVEYSDLYW